LPGLTRKLGGKRPDYNHNRTEYTLHNHLRLQTKYMRKCLLSFPQLNASRGDKICFIFMFFFSSSAKNCKIILYIQKRLASKLVLAVRKSQILKFLGSFRDRKSLKFLRCASHQNANPPIFMTNPRIRKFLYCTALSQNSPRST